MLIHFRVTLDFIVIPMIFYIVVAAAQLDLGMLTQKGWLFDMGDSADESWYEFYHYYGGYISLPSLGI